MLHPGRFNCPAPRYTSYPTAPNWESIEPQIYSETLSQLNDSPLSLYVHIPFCHSMCLFCGCSVILNRDEEKEEKYVSYLCKEIDILASHVKKRKTISQLHFGGGTPTKLKPDLFQKVLKKIWEHFDVKGEIAIEIDPRTTDFEKLVLLKKWGFNRVSFGVQDTNPEVQEAIKRRQSEKMTRETFQLARTLGFEEINLDLIYGLPKQTEKTFQKTMDVMIELKPDRLALFSYAKIPWLKPHQKAIKESDLPSLEEKFKMYCEARGTLVTNGYIAIGMDHFATQESDFAKSYREKTLSRNFQGYTIKRSDTLLGIGVTAIGYTQEGYTQNVKDLPSYYGALDSGKLPTSRGKRLTFDDQVRKWVIEKLMCTFSVDKEEFFKRYAHSFDAYFSEIDFSSVSDLITETKNTFQVSKEGELFIRNVAMLFDAYLKPSSQKFSLSI